MFRPPFVPRRSDGTARSARSGRSWPALGLAVLLMAGLPAAAASAKPDPGTDGGPAPAVTGWTCPLSRAGTHLARCDYLTGAGVRAPYFVPEGR